MTSNLTVTLPPIPVRLSQHAIVVARLSAAHARGEHLTPIVACHDCLNGVQAAQVALRKAA